MGTKLTGYTTWDAQAKERRADDAQALSDTYGITPEDIIQFPKSPVNSAKVKGKALSISTDGSVTCSAAGKLRSIAPEKIEVKRRGPRGGTVWVPIVSETP